MVHFFFTFSTCTKKRQKTQNSEKFARLSLHWNKVNTVQEQKENCNYESTRFISNVNDCNVVKFITKLEKWETSTGIERNNIKDKHCVCVCANGVNGKKCQPTKILQDTKREREKLFAEKLRLK